MRVLACTDDSVKFCSVTYRAAFIAELQSHFHHVDWLNYAGGKHARNTTIYKWLYSRPHGAWSILLSHFQAGKSYRASRER
jgi:hypothetical protein